MFCLMLKNRVCPVDDKIFTSALDIQQELLQLSAGVDDGFGDSMLVTCPGVGSVPVGLVCLRVDEIGFVVLSTPVVPVSPDVEPDGCGCLVLPGYEVGFVSVVFEDFVLGSDGIVVPVIPVGLLLPVVDPDGCGCSVLPGCPVGTA